MDTTNNTLRVHDGQTAGGIPLAKQSEISGSEIDISTNIATDKDSNTKAASPKAVNDFVVGKNYVSSGVLAAYAKVHISLYSSK